MLPINSEELVNTVLVVGTKQAKVMKQLDLKKIRFIGKIIEILV